MNCQTCGSDNVVKNGASRHGRQRWLCRACGKTCGPWDHRRVAIARRAAALAHYRAGAGLRATERLVGVSHNAVMNWLLAELEGTALAATAPGEVEWVGADEIWSHLALKKRPAGCGGLLIVLPNRTGAGRWGIVEPAQPAAWMRSFLSTRASSPAPENGTPAG